MSRFSWDARAAWHGERLAREGRELTQSLIGQLARHEGADVTVAAIRDFSIKLQAAYHALLGYGLIG